MKYYTFILTILIPVNALQRNPDLNICGNDSIIAGSFISYPELISQLLCNFNSHSDYFLDRWMLGAFRMETQCFRECCGINGYRVGGGF